MEQERSSTDDVKSQDGVQVFAKDWGEVTHELTKKHGEVFAVLNLANAIVSGGGYMRGTAAQEENMFRRTDAHFTNLATVQQDVQVKWYYQDNAPPPAQLPRATTPAPGGSILPLGSSRVKWEWRDMGSDTDPNTGKATRRWIASPKYDEDQKDLVNAASTTYPGLVSFTGERRVCFRKSEANNCAEMDISDVFPFYELRSAAIHVGKDGATFDIENTRHRIKAQLKTLIVNKIKHVVLGAFGCGAFKNPPKEVAKIYREEIDKVRSNFEVIAFAVLDVQSTDHNYDVFEEVFGRDRNLATSSKTKKVVAIVVVSAVVVVAAVGGAWIFFGRRIRDQGAAAVNPPNSEDETSSSKGSSILVWPIVLVGGVITAAALFLVIRGRRAAASV